MIIYQFLQDYNSTNVKCLFYLKCQRAQILQLFSLQTPQMQNVSEFQMYQSLITGALFGQSQFRKEFEAELCKYRSQDPQRFICICASIACNQAKDENLRQGAGIVLAGTVRIQFQDTHMKYWESVSAQNKNAIKENLLASLISKSEKVKRSLANVIAVIAGIEFVYSGWEYLLDLLLNIINKDAAEVMMTSVMTLGFINMELSKYRIKPTQSQSERIFAGIVVGLQKAQQDPSIKPGVKNILYDALKNSVVFLVDLFENENPRVFLFNSLLQGLKSDETVVSALESLGEVCKYGYLYLQNWMREMFKSLEEVINKQEHVIAAIEIWNIIGRQYIQREQNPHTINNPNHLMEIHPYLADLLLKQIVRKDTSQDLKNTIIETLETLVSATGTFLFNKILEFVANSINDQNQNIRQASMLVFSSLVEARQKREEVVAHFNNGFDVLFSTLKDSSELVLKSSLQGWLRMFVRLEFKRAFIKKSTAQKNVDLLLRFLEPTYSQDIHYLVLNLIQNLFEELTLAEGEVDILLVKLLRHITQYSFQSKSSHLQNLGFCAVLMVLISNQNTKTAEQYVQHLLERLKRCTNLKHPMVQSVADVIGVGLKRMSKVDPNLTLMKSLYDFVVRYFFDLQQVDEAGFYILAGMAYTYKRNFQPYCVQAEKFSIQGLRSYQDLKTYHSAVGYVTDISNYVPNYFKNNFKVYMNLLVEGLNADISREMKMVVLDTIGDVICTVGKETEPFLPSVIRMVETCYRASAEPCVQDQYIENLRACLMRLQYNILLAFADSGDDNQILKQHFEQSIHFMMHTTGKQFNPQISYLKQCVELAYFVAKNFGYMDLINVPEFYEKIEALKKFTASDEELAETIAIISRSLFQYQRQRHQ